MQVDELEPASGRDEIEEGQLFSKVIRAFASYSTRSLDILNKKRDDFNSIPLNHQRLVPDFHRRMDLIQQRIRANARFLTSIIADQENFLNGESSSGSLSLENHEPLSEADHDKVRSTLRQFVRDWSKDGEDERTSAYTPILKEIESLFAQMPREDRGKIQILVPGAGLGRLAFEIASRGYSCQGNEFSFYMLLGAHFVLNRVVKVEQFDIYPWIHSFSNNLTAEHQLHKVCVPDVITSVIPKQAEFSMIAGDFVEVYNNTEQREQWDVIATCFFIDTAKNILEYLETIHNALKSGGRWINHGPLLYHFEGMKNELSVELNLSEVLEAARKIGFHFDKEPELIKATYASNSKNMLSYVYDSAFFTATKV
ncbi:N2227-like protein-domain-containing protein [Polychytrium aggregatum]|uniref:N2227-like protein-domain-containing protein n=1 Tax=Polychytrium aggregatum TaxID=110093 RepID=UPI0022FE3AD8|nr:N2227-like protein-domain-containing protein [Polychytrium aggregatum]KAI9207266.1 N2227-like protein-domain-containing protein [Polychytrium aggregatum]